MIGKIGLGNVANIFFPAIFIKSENLMKKILLIEDHLMLLRLFGEELQSLGYETISCQDLPSAKAAWDDHKEEIGIVVTDGNYRENVRTCDDAAALVTYIRDGDKNIPILLVSGDERAWKHFHADLAVTIPAFDKMRVLTNPEFLTALHNALVVPQDAMALHPSEREQKPVVRDGFPLDA